MISLSKEQVKRLHENMIIATGEMEYSGLLALILTHLK